MSPDLGHTLSSISSILPKVDAVSLHFAPYSFHPKGLSIRTLIKLAVILAKKTLHITFHEIWIGAFPKAPWRERLIGGLQRKSIQRFLQIAKPKAVYSTNAASIDRLRKAGIAPKYLYLFGNINTQCKTINKSADECIKKPIVTFFGTPYLNFPYSQLIENLVELFKSLRAEPIIRILGAVREGSGLSLLREEAKHYALPVEETGRLSTEDLAIEFQAAACGVSTTPFDALGKSSSTAAMLEHGLPVVAHDDGDTPQEVLFAPGPFKERIVLLEQTDFVNRLIKLIKAPKPQFFDGAAYTADSFISFLSSK